MFHFQKRSFLQNNLAQKMSNCIKNISFYKISHILQKKEFCLAVSEQELLYTDFIYQTDLAIFFSTGLKYPPHLYRILNKFENTMITRDHFNYDS